MTTKPLTTLLRLKKGDIVHLPDNHNRHTITDLSACGRFVKVSHTGIPNSGYWVAAATCRIHNPDEP